jgi:hypothetical protein
MSEFPVMTPDEERGRHQLIGIGIATWLPPVLGALVGVNPPLLAALVPGALLVGLLRGWSWARTWTTVSLGLGAVAATLGVIMADSVPHRIASAVSAIGWGLAAVTLERSEAIDAYCERPR